MTEEEWLTCNDPIAVMCGLQNRISQRKYDLFELACAASMSADWPDQFCQTYFDYVEREVEGGNDVPDDEADRMADAISELSLSLSHRASAVSAEHGEDSDAARSAYRLYVAVALLQSVRGAMEWWYWLPDLCHAIDASSLALMSTYQRCLPLLRCVVGNPFRPVAVELHWLTATVRDLAAAVYAGRAFDRLPVLADALEEAGCDNPDVLAHCRGPGPHVRGCWVVDLILGKS